MKGWGAFGAGISNHKGRGMVGVCHMFEVVVDIVEYYSLLPGKEREMGQQA